MAKRLTNLIVSLEHIQSNSNRLQNLALSIEYSEILNFIRLKNIAVMIEYIDSPAPPYGPPVQMMAG